MSDCVVVGQECGGYWVGSYNLCECDHCSSKMMTPEPTPQPRALVALSDDRQWLVVLDPDGYSGWFVRYRLNAYGYWIPDVQAGEPCCIRDTGQDAHAVLAEWMEGRSGER